MVSWGRARISLSQGSVLSREYFPSSFIRLPTALASKVLWSVMSFRFHPLLNRLTFDLDFCMYIGHSLTITCRGLKVKVICQLGQRSMQNMCAARVFTAASYEYWLVALVVCFHRSVISCELAGAASSAHGHCDAVGLTSIFNRGQFF